MMIDSRPVVIGRSLLANQKRWPLVSTRVFDRYARLRFDIQRKKKEVDYGKSECL